MEGAKCQVQQLRNGQSAQAVPNSIIITFCNEDLVYDLQIKLFQVSCKDHLRITIINKSAASEFYYESIFSMETLPADFKAIYDTLPELFDFILSNFEEALQIQFQGQRKENAVLNVKVLIIKKFKQYKLGINGKPLTEFMKEEANLFKLTKEIEIKQKLLAALKERDSVVSRELAANQKQVERLIEEEKALIQKAAYYVQLEETHREKCKEIQSKIANRKLQLQSMYKELLKQGFTFSKEQTNLLTSVMKSSKEPVGVKKLRYDPEESIQKVQLVKDKCAQKVDEGEQRKDQKEIGSKSKAGVPIKNKPNFKLQYPPQQKEQSVVRHQKRKLQIKDSQDISCNLEVSKERQQKMIRQVNESQKNVISPFMQGSSQPHNLISIGSSGKSIPVVVVKPPEPVVTVLSSESEQQEMDQYSKQIGEKVTLDFTSSQNITKYKVQYAKSRTYIQRIVDDNNFYHLYHRQPVRNKQNMQISISQMVKHDLTFGIMGKDALKMLRMEWPKEVVCWVGCSRQVVNQIDNKKKSYWIEPSDSITVAVDTPAKSVSFYVNRKLMHKEEAVEEKIISECYFFFQTASRGTKIYYL